jgi:hypothetical protein
MAYLFAVWACFLVFAASALYRMIVFKRLRQELASQTVSTLGQQSNANANLIDLLKEHKARFPASRTRALSNILIGFQMLAATVGVALGIVAQFQPHSFFHLIAGR